MQCTRLNLPASCGFDKRIVVITRRHSSGFATTDVIHEPVSASLRTSLRRRNDKAGIVVPPTIVTRLPLVAFLPGLSQSRLASGFTGGRRKHSILCERRQPHLCISEIAALVVKPIQALNFSIVSTRELHRCPTRSLRAKPRKGIDFFPLTVDYREKLPAAGKFPGGFRKREGPPNQKEILTMRLNA